MYYTDITSHFQEDPLYSHPSGTTMHDRVVQHDMSSVGVYVNRNIPWKSMLFIPLLYFPSTGLVYMNAGNLIVILYTRE